MFQFPLAAAPSRLTTYFRPAELLNLVAQLKRARAKRGTEVEAGNRTPLIHSGNLDEPNALDPPFPTARTPALTSRYFSRAHSPFPSETSKPAPAVAFIFASQRLLSPKLGTEYASTPFILENTRTASDATQRCEYFQRCAQILAEACPVALVLFYRDHHLRPPPVLRW